MTQNYNSLDAMPVTPNNNLVTIHTFKDQDYLIRFEIASSRINLSISDKQIGEEWKCSYDQTCDCRFPLLDIENLTTKSGNFKTFEIFTRMLNSGLLKSSRSITLNLLTHEELNSFQNTSNMKPYFRSNTTVLDENVRYLIVGYITEFDQTFYPLTLEYCGTPDVKSLIATIRRLESDLANTREEFALYKVHHHDQRARKHKNNEEMQKRITELTIENEKLRGQIRQKSATKVSTKAELVKTASVESALLKLEKGVVTERRNHQKYIDQLEKEKSKMRLEIETLKRNESALKQRLALCKASSGVFSISDKQSGLAKSRQNTLKSPLRTRTNNSQQKVNNGRASSKCSRSLSGCDSSKSRSCSLDNKSRGRVSRIYKAARFDSSQSSETTQSRTSSTARSEQIKLKLQSSQHDYNVLEKRISGLQKKLLTQARK